MLAGHGWGEQLRLVDHDQHRVPNRSVGLEQAVEEGGGGAHLPLGIEGLQRQHHRHPVLAHPRGDARQGALVAVGLDDDVAVALGQRNEVSFRVDDRLLHQAGALLQQPAQQVRLARAGVALHQEAGGEQLDQVEARRFGAGETEIDRKAHARNSRGVPSMTGA